MLIHFELKTSIKQLLFVSVLLIASVLPSAAEAATLSLSPATGVYTTGSTFTANVIVDTKGSPVNAADATISFNTNELSVVSVNRSGSIFNLWVTEPTFSNTNGTISFSGGSPSGYTGSNGSVMTITFRTKSSGASRVNFKTGSVLANDGKGTNVLTNMDGGSYTIQAVSAAPEPEVIEYVAPANTPKAPVVISETHNDPNSWHKSTTAKLTWKLPSDATSVRTLLDSNPSSIPTKVYDSPIDNITLTDLPEGESYFHLQIKNADGWGKVTHFRLAVDSISPTSINISSTEDSSPTNPEQVVNVLVKDDTTSVKKFIVKIDGGEPIEFSNETGSGTIKLPPLKPGFYTIAVTAFDLAGNSILGTHSFTIEAFDKPTFTEYPTEINEEVIPVIKGLTRPNAVVTVSLNKIGGEPANYNVLSSETGEFVFIPEGTFTLGVYELSAQAVDEFGAVSEVSEKIRIAVQQPGYLMIGTMLVSVLSVIVPLIALLLLLILSFWFMLRSIRRFRKQVRTESIEALDILQREFGNLRLDVSRARNSLEGSRRTKKLTRAEADVLESFEKALAASEKRVRAEIEDVSELVDTVVSGDSKNHTT